MAFVQDIDAPRVSTGSTTMPGDKSDVLRLGGLENALKVAGQFASDLAGQTRAVQTDQVVGETVGGINDLLEERQHALNVEAHASRQLSSIASDGDITPEEEESLQALQKSQDFLRKARTTGVLSEAGFSTRMNALRRSMVSRAENLGIQSNIEELFLRSQSLNEEPVQDPGIKVVQDQMDAMHGAGQWDVTQAAQFVASEAKFQTVLRNVDSNVADLTFAMKHKMETALLEKQRKVSLGGIFTEKDALDIVAGAQETALGILDNINEQEKQLRATGRMTAARREEMNAKKQNILGIRDFYTQQITGKQSVPEYFSTNEVFDRADKTMNLFMKMNMPVSARAMQNMTGSNGSNSALSADVVFSLFDPESANMKVWELAAANDPLNRTAAQLQQSEFAAVSAWVSGNISVDQLVDGGFINPGVAQALSIAANKRPMRTPEEVEAYVDIQSATLKPSPNNIKANGDKIATLVQSFETSMANARSQGRESEVIIMHKEKFQQHADELKGYLERKTGMRIPVTPDGGIGMPTVRPEVARALEGESGSLGVATTPDDVLSKSTRVFAAYTGKLLDAGIITREDIANTFSPSGTVVDPATGVELDAFTGAGETPRAAINRNVTQPGPAQEIEPPQALQQQGVTEPVDSDILATIQLESGGNASAVNQGSGAAGILQLIPERAREEGIDPLNPNESIQVFKEHRQSVTPRLQRAGLEPTGANVYILWQQGVTGGMEILRNLDKKISDLPASRQSNMMDNQPPVPEWQSISDKEDAMVSEWVQGWQQRFNAAK